MKLPNMRSIFLFSGFVGFVIVLLAGFSAGRAPDLVLRDAAFGCLAGALLGRWFSGVMTGAIREALQAKREAAKARAESPAPAAPSKSVPPARTAPGAARVPFPPLPPRPSAPPAPAARSR
ncbi:hypothetical protein OPIT5_24925 [Opitutaceae bacterium TAV5]|nr:hypothetical protein OPIT5_24925 [Opitutaceae bacterium TAV5]